MSILLGALLLAAAPQAAPSTDSQPAQTAAPAPKPAKEKKICRTNDEQTGTRMPARTCRTASQWEALSGGQDTVDVGNLGPGVRQK
jgi:hypothetical protein